MTKLSTDQAQTVHQLNTTLGGRFSENAVVHATVRMPDGSYRTYSNTPGALRSVLSQFGAGDDVVNVTP